MDMHYRVQRFFLYLLFKIYFRLTVSGVEHLPRHGSLIIAANHCSFLDPPIIAVAIPRQISFLAKKELFSTPLLGWWIDWVGAHPVDRKQGDIAALRTLMRLLKSDKAVLIFPEGTRSTDGVMQPHESGAAWLSVKSQVPILPVAVRGLFESMPRDAWFPKPNKVRIQVGEALTPPEASASNQEAVTQVRDQLQQRMEHLLQSLSPNKP